MSLKSAEGEIKV